jgi:hypothetical protein
MKNDNNIVPGQEVKTENTGKMRHNRETNPDSLFTG